MRLLVLLGVLLVGCSSQPVTTPEVYLLRSAISQQPQAALTEVPRLALDKVTVADYLDQPGLMLEQSDGTMHRARQHLWAEPLRNSVPRFLANEIGAEIGAPVAVNDVPVQLPQLYVRIDQLHGTSDGGALLVAYWELQPVNGDVRSYRFTRRQALGGDGYAALVAAQKQLLTQLAAEIAAQSGG